jgi:eukaryotic-like serine/threonine-protein kinase
MSKAEKFGKYILLEKLAVGGMAEVYLAKSSGANGVNKFVAIKRILPQYSTNPEFIAMFKEEAKVAINLSHSNIVSIYDFGIEKDQFFIVMEFVEGQNLRQIINEMKKSNKSFSIDQAVFIKEAAAGLNHAHRCVDSQSGKPLNITHRDMSPQNIMISFEAEAKVIDFGIAKSETETEATKAGTLKGKFSYMSPEQSEGYAIDPRTDVFALGIILWELLANDRLFTGSNEGAILRKVRDCQIPAIRKINPTVPQELERIVMKALAKDKNVRYQTAANFHKDLNLFLNTQYPDFSTHDFSQFIRNCFKSTYTERKEKLISFSKVEAIEEDLSITEAVAPSPALSTIPTPTPSAFENNPATPHKETHINGIKLKTTHGPEEEEQIEIAGLKINKDLKPNLENLRTATMTRKVGIGNTKNTSYTQKSQTRQKPAKVTKNVEQRVIFLIILFFAGIYGYQYYFNSAVVKKPTVAKKVIQGSIELATTASTKVSVSSNPSGAKIFVDNVATDQLTPSIVTVTSNKETNIILKKENYNQFQIKKTFSEPSSLTAELIPTPPMGYLDIEIINGGENPIIEVNGVKLNDKAPIIQYPVPAFNDTIINVRNPFSGYTARQKVKVAKNKTEKVLLILGGPKK